MSWKPLFGDAVTEFKNGNHEEALRLFDQAARHGGDQQYIVYDSRAAVYEKLGKVKEALRDAKKAISLAPSRWQGYARAARLFLLVRKVNETITMADMALARVKLDDTRRRDELQRMKEDAREIHRRFACHLATLPVELLTEVFSDLVTHDHNQVLVLSHVCRHWRDVALNVPTLWGTLVLHQRAPVAKTRWYIKHSKGRIRDLSLRKNLKQSLDWSLDSLRHMDWRHLRVCRVQDWDIYPYLEKNLLTLFLPNLEELHVEDSKGSMIARDNLISFEDSKLRSLHLENARCSIKTAQLHLTRLTNITLRDCVTVPRSPVDLALLLENNPLLETLTLHQVNLDTVWTTANHTMARLTHLDIDRISWSLDLFRNVAFPSLTHLSIARSGLPIDFICTTLRASGCTGLSFLSISMCTVSSSSLIDLLRVLELLETLSLLHLFDTANAVVEALATPTKAEPAGVYRFMCPALKHLNVSHCPEVETGPLNRLVKTRLPKPEMAEAAEVAKITTLKMDGCPRIEAKFIPWFRSRVDEFSCVYMTKKAASYRR